MDFLWRVGQMAYHTGSRAICQPPPTDTDDDYVVLAYDDTQEELLAAGYQRTSREQYGDLVGFTAFRKGEVNVILAHREEFYFNFVRATKLCRKLNLMKKEDRVAVFQAVLYGRYPS